MTTQTTDRGEHDRLAQAERLLRQNDDLAAARRLAQAVTEEHPDSGDAHSLLAQIALAERDAGALDRHLRRAAECSPDDAERQASYGVFALRGGRPADAVEPLRRATELMPQYGLYRLYLGVALLMIKDERGAERAFMSLLLIQPELLTHKNVQATHDFVIQYVEVARRFMQRSYARMFADILMRVQARYSDQAVQRLRETFHILLGIRPYPTMAPMQAPKALRFPGLRGQPFYDPADFPWLADLERRADEIAAEFIQLQTGAEDAFLPYFRAGDKQPALKHGYQTDLVGSKKWNSFHLYRHGRLDDHCARCPITAECMEQLPLAHAEQFMPEVFFSVLQSGARIPPHYGLSNMRLAVHLPLIIPDHCGIRVGTETRHWQRGRCLVFDDSFEHEAWNDSGEDRVVLIFEIWHPDLSAAEIEGLQAFFAARAEFLNESSDQVPGR